MQSFTNQPPRTTRQLVINWHLTETCNYGCRYCYSSWQRPDQNGEIFRNPEASSDLLQDLYRFFHPDYRFNPLQEVLRWQSIRLSLAGGETLLYPHHTLRIAQQAKTLGFTLSLITNGSRLYRSDIPALAETLSMLGISLDSAAPKTNRRIGRVDQSGRIIDLDDLTKKIKLARTVNPRLEIKINTVVNTVNAAEDLSPLIERLQPTKWKVLRVLPMITGDLSVSDQQFWTFVERHRHLGQVLAAEDNQDMTESYLMVDPFGRFFQNQENSEEASPYIYSQPILEGGAGAAFPQIQFDANKFASRYLRFQ